MKTKKLIWTITILIIILLSIGTYFYFTNYNYNETILNNDQGIIFETNQLVSFNDADLGFLGIEDKTEGELQPYLYGHYENTRILEKQKFCGEIIPQDNIENRAIHFENGKTYCVYLKQSNKFIELKILNLAQDWNSFEFKWKIIEIKQQTNETQTIIENIRENNILYSNIVLMIFSSLVIIYLLTKINQKKK